MYIPDLGDEHRRQHGPDAGDLLDRGVAGIMGQSTLPTRGPTFVVSRRARRRDDLRADHTEPIAWCAAGAARDDQCR
jgi:hypothetical protein